jgi:hypothetical protein
MQARGVLINASPVVRLVTHLDVNRQQLSEVVAHWQAFYSAKESGVSQSFWCSAPAAILASIWCAR